MLNLVGGAGFNDLPNSVVTNYGTVVWSSGTVRGGGNLGTVFYNYGLWDVQGDNAMTADYAQLGVRFNNLGTFRKSASAGITTLQSGVTFTNVVSVVVTDNGTPSLSATNTFTVLVNEVNVAPVLPVQTNRTLVELATLIVTNTATDADLPINSLTYQLVNPPAGAVIDPNGVITWTPSEAQGPSTNLFTTIVNEVNTPPGLNALSDFTVNAGQTIAFTATATDADPPANALSFSLLSAPPTASITSGGAFTWRVPVASANSTNTIQVRVTDDGSPALSDTRVFAVVINPLGAVTLTLLGYTNHQFSFRVDGPDGPDYVIAAAAATNLTSFADLATNASPVPPFTFLDTNTVPNNRFYRVRLAP